MEKPQLNLRDADGNAFSLLAKARKVALANNMDWAAIEKEAKAGDYDHLLQTLMQHFEVTV